MLYLPWELMLYISSCPREAYPNEMGKSGDANLFPNDLLWKRAYKIEEKCKRKKERQEGRKKTEKRERTTPSPPVCEALHRWRLVMVLA